MTKAKEALDLAQAAYNALNAKTKEGKADEEAITKVTEALTRAKSDYKSELERVLPRQQELTKAFKDARDAYDAAEINLRKTQKAFEDGKASASDLAAAQLRVNDASVGLKTAQSALNDITKQTGQTFKEYSGGIDDVRKSLQDHNTHTQTAKELQAALKAEVDQAKQAFVKAFETYRTGTADVASVQAAYENLQAAQDRQHPEKAAEAFVAAREAERKKMEENQRWYEETYLPKEEQLTNAEEQQQAKLQQAFFKAHEAIKTSAESIVPVVYNVFKQIGELEADENLAGVAQAIENTKKVSQAYKDLGITSTASIENHAKEAKKNYEIIANSGIASANDILKAEKVALEAEIQARYAAGDEITAEQRKRLKELNDALNTSLKDQKTYWEEFSGDVLRISNKLNNDISHAFIDLFEGGGWTKFKEAGIKALEEIGASVIRLGIEYIEGILIKKLKDIFMDGGVLDLLVDAFKKVGSFLLDLFSSIGSSIVDGVKAAIGWITNAVGGGASAAGSAAGAAGSAAGSAGSAAGSAGSAASGAASGVAGIVGAVAGVASAISGIVGNFQMAKQETTLNAIEESTRYTKAYLRDNIIPDEQKYWPKLEGINEFNYNILAPVLSDISQFVAEKGDKIYAGIVVDLKNEIIDIKNNFHDLLFALLDVVSALDVTNTLLTTISGSLDEIKFMTGSVERSSMQSASADQQAASVAVQESSALMSLNSGILALAPAFSAAIANLDIRGALSSSLSSIGSQFSNAVSNIDIRSTLQGGFNNLSSQLGSLAGSIISATSSMRVTAPSTSVYLTVAGSTVSSSTAGLAAQLAAYGIRL
jgi:hypothetical protein